MMTDKQLVTLINYIRIEAQGMAGYGLHAPKHEITQARRELSTAFGFEAHKNGYPVTPVNSRCHGPTTERQQAEADADHDNKIEAIRVLLDTSDADMHTSHGAPEIVRLWPQIKAIMEPARARCPHCGAVEGPWVSGQVCSACDNRMFKASDE